MLNLMQLLELVVANPNRSACDMRLIVHIWEAFTKWCAEQFDQHKGVKFLGLGEFTMRHDIIGNMDFWNPMFVLSEGFARAHGLHDRRPKTQSTAVENVEVDMAKLAQMTTDSLGEVVGREVVEAALLDIVDRIGTACADEATGVVTLDFKWGKLICENKSLEFVYGDGKPPPTGKSANGSKPPGTAGSSRGGPRTAGSESGLGLAGSGIGRRTQPDAPLQRPHRPHIKAAVKVTTEDMLQSHDRQLDDKRHQLEVHREEEAAQHYDSLQRLRGEMMVEYGQRQERRQHNAALAAQQQQQAEEKKARDVQGRKVAGINHWPFRTEEQVQAQVDAANSKQKDWLDAQLVEKQQKRAFLERQLARQAAKAKESNVGSMVEEERQRAHAMASSQASVSKTLDQAYSRYEDYLSKRKQVEQESVQYVREQRYLSEQVELLKQEENRRRMEDMRKYLEVQKREKLAKDAREKLDARTDADAGGTTATLPTGIEPDPEEELFVKQALRRALDGQVAQKESSRQQAVEQEKQQQQHVLNCVALEMRQARFRELSQKRDQAEALQTTWKKQEQLKKLELEIEKAR